MAFRLTRKNLVLTGAMALTGCLAGDILTSDADHTVTGPSGDYFGRSVLGIVSLDNNSSKDIAVGASGADEVRMYRRGFNGQTWSLTQFSTFVGEAGGEAGWSLSWGSLGGTNSRDLIIGAPSERDGKGRVYVIDGKSVTTPTIDASDAIIAFRGTQENEFLGWDTVTGDFDGDGERDIALGACGWSDDEDFQGRIYIFHGPLSPGMNNVNNADVVISGSPAVGGNPTGEQLGCSLAAGDVDNDGDQELLAGATFAGSTFNGRVYLFDDPSSGTASQVAARTYSGVGGFKFFGSDVDAGLDLNGDGIDDMVIGAAANRCATFPNNPECQPGAAAPADRRGAVFVHYGQDGSFPSTSADVTIDATSDDTAFGLRLSMQADINNDGFAEFHVIEPGADRSLFYYGTDNLSSGTQLTTQNRGINFDDSQNSRIPTAVGRCNDINSDGNRDILFSSGRGSFNGAPQAGHVHLFFGED